MPYVNVLARMRIPFHIRYRCSKCGAVNDRVSDVVEDGEMIGRVPFDEAFKSMPFKKNLEKLKREALKRVEHRMAWRLDKIQTLHEEHRYDTAEFDCKCTVCGHREPWARMRYGKWLELVAGLGTVIVGLRWLFRRAWSESLILFVPLDCTFFLSLLGLVIYKWVHTRRMNKLIAKLPQDSLPTFTYTTDEKVVEYKVRHRWW